jgi:hypothetical protein
MAKQYKLKIPEMIKYEDAKNVLPRLATIENGEIIDQAIVDFAKIPQDWLEEIKEPITFDEWLHGENTGLNGDAEDPEGLASNAWYAAIENEKLKKEQ